MKQFLNRIIRASTLTAVALLIINNQVFSQFKRSSNDSISTKIYRAQPKLEIPLYLAIIGAASLGFKATDKLASLDSTEVARLDPLTINSFDRPVAYNNPANFQQAQKISDVLLTVFVLSPGLLLLDKKVRRDWQDYLSVVFSAHAADNVMYFSSVVSVRRPRPLTYNPAVPFSSKIGGNRTNSFFSGHVTWVATSTFLLAKIYTDYHQVTGLKRILLYSAASVPPAIMGYFRMQAGKHFPSDVLTGFVVGAASGILLPELHRKKGGPEFSFLPFSQKEATGVTMIYRFK